MSESTDNKPGAEQQQQTKEKSEATQQNIDTATSHPAASVSQKPCEVRVNVTINKEGKIQNTKIENPQVITECMKSDAKGGKRRGRSRRRGKRGGRKSKRRSSKKARKSKKSKRRSGKKSKRRRRRK